MIRALGIGSFLLILAGCAGPEDDFLVDTRSDAMGEAVMEEPVAAAPLPVEVACGDPGDGIGGTGCPVD